MTINVYPPYGSSALNPSYVAFGDGYVDAFGRLRVSQPFTLFDSQARYAADPQYSYAVTGSGATSFNTNQSSVNLTVGTAAGTASAQSYRVFPYQPGKSLLLMQTFTMAAGQANLLQKVGYFNTNNGVYFGQNNTTKSFTIRTYTSGAATETTVNQSSWNGDKLDGTGPSGLTLDTTKTQILFIDIEWLGVGSVRCGFVINSQFITCHTFYNANTTQTTVYMQTAILPLRYEISATGTVTGTPILQQICSTAISEGGYQQTSQQYVARATAAVTVGTTFTPLVSIRLNSSYLGAVVLANHIDFLPIGSGQYEIALIKNGTLTGATYAATQAAGQVDVDTAATAIAYSADNIVQNMYATATNQASSTVLLGPTYNFDLQLGVSQAGVSDVYTLAARTMTGTNTCLGSLSFWDLTV